MPPACSSVGWAQILGGGWAAPSWAGEQLSRLERSIRVDGAVTESVRVVGGLDAPALGLACVCYALSALSKEFGFTLLGVTVVYGFASCLQTKLKTLSTFIVQNSLIAMTAATILWYRAEVSGDSVAPTIPWMDNPAGWQPSLVTRCLSYMYQHTVQAGLLIFPLHLRMDYR